MTELPTADAWPRSGRPPTQLAGRIVRTPVFDWDGPEIARPPARRHQRQPQARAVPAHRLVQGARRAGRDAGPGARGAGARRDRGQRRQPRHRHRLGGARAGHSREGGDAGQRPIPRGSPRRARYGARAGHGARRRRGASRPPSGSSREEGRAFVHPFEGPLTARGTATVGLEWLEQVAGSRRGHRAGRRRRPARRHRLRGQAAAARTAWSSASSRWAPTACGAASPPAARSGSSGSRPSPTAWAPPTRCPTASACAAASSTRSCGSRMRPWSTPCAWRFDTLKLALEPAGAAATAALLGPLRERLAGRRVGVLVCGSNIDLGDLRRDCSSGAGRVTP